MEKRCRRDRCPFRQATDFRGDCFGQFLHPNRSIRMRLDRLQFAPVFSPSGSIKGDVKKKHSSSSARREYFSDIQPPSADARILAGARLGRTDFAGGCGIMN